MPYRSYKLDATSLAIMNVRFLAAGDITEFNGIVQDEAPDIICFQNVMGAGLEGLAKLGYTWHVFVATKFTTYGTVGTAIFSRIEPAATGSKDGDVYMNFGSKFQVFSAAGAEQHVGRDGRIYTHQLHPHGRPRSWPRITRP